MCQIDCHSFVKVWNDWVWLIWIFHCSQWVFYLRVYGCFVVLGTSHWDWCTCWNIPGFWTFWSTALAVWSLCQCWNPRKVGEHDWSSTGARKVGLLQLCFNLLKSLLLVRTSISVGFNFSGLGLHVVCSLTSVWSCSFSIETVSRQKTGCLPVKPSYRQKK